MKESYRLYDEGRRAHTTALMRSVVVPTSKGVSEPFVLYVLKQRRDVFDARASSTLSTSVLVTAILFTYETALRRVLGTGSPLVIYVTLSYSTIRLRLINSERVPSTPRR